MASNYTFSEAVELIAKGDMKAIQDIGRRFPILATKIATVSALAGESFIDLASYMPDYLTANKVNKRMRDALEETDKTETDETENDETENDETENDETENDENEEVDNEAEETDNPYEGKTAMELFKECKKRGIKAAAKKPAKFYADLLLKADAEGEDDEDEDDDWDI